MRMDLPWRTPPGGRPTEPPKRETPLDYALAYAELGLRVFPLIPQQKIPFKNSSGVKEATTDKEQIRLWWTNIPTANIGIAMGDGLLAIDVDVADGKQGDLSWQTLVEKHGLIPTIQNITGTGGWHFIFKAPPGVRIKNSASKLGPGLDVRGDGGYIIGEPSIHPNGKHYTWEAQGDPLEGVEIREAPSSLIELVRADETTTEPREPGPVGGTLSEGGRNDTLARFAGLARGAGLDMQSTAELVHGINSRFCDPPLEAREIDSTILKSAQGWQSEAVDTSALDTVPASALVVMEPPEREWLLEDWIPMRQTTALYAAGGSGKTLLAQQLMHAVATGEPWLGLPVKQGPALGVFCEDEGDELHRRLHAIVASSGGVSTNLSQCHLLPRIGQDNLLMTFDRDVGSRTAFWWQLRATVEHIKPCLLVVDTAADTYGGNENARPQVRQFIQQCLTALAVEFKCAVVLCAHPSAAGIQTGSGDGGSTAWTNSVRSRLYLEADESGAFSTLSRKKSNYAAAGESFEICWSSGAFIPRVEAEGLAGADGYTDSERAFLQLYRWCEEREILLSPHPRQPTYPPKYFRKIQRELGYKFQDADYEIVVQNWLQSGSIHIASRQTKHRNWVDALVRTGAENGN